MSDSMSLKEINEGAPDAKISSRWDFLKQEARRRISNLRSRISKRENRQDLALARKSNREAAAQLTSSYEGEWQQFGALREKVHRQMQGEIANRIRTNPTPTAEEISLGAYIEEIEPQCRRAVLEMRRKGYETIDSGFGGENRQFIGWSSLDLRPEVQQRLQPLGASLTYRIPEKRLLPVISFRAASPDINAMNNQWNNIVAALPDLGKPAKPRQSVAADRFRQQPTNYAIRSTSAPSK